MEYVDTGANDYSATKRQQDNTGMRGQACGRSAGTKHSTEHDIGAVRVLRLDE